jgi:hypothetical protein
MLTAINSAAELMIGHGRPFKCKENCLRRIWQSLLVIILSRAKVVIFTTRENTRLPLPPYPSEGQRSFYREN